MTLKRRLFLQMSVTITGIALLGLAAVVGVSGLHQDMSVAVRANEQLRQAYTVGSRVNASMTQLHLNDPAAAKRQVLSDLHAAHQLFDALARSPHARLAETTDALDRVDAAFTAATARVGRLDVRDRIDSAEFAPILSTLADLSAQTQAVLIARQQSADALRTRTLIGVGSLASLALLAAIVIAVRQYRAVMQPLDRLRETSRALAAGQLDRRLATVGDREFAEVASDFNAMGDELQHLYAELEARIRDKSRELIRSERLASVGYLAAGVAHEINNPLGIITGYGERSLQRLSRGLDADSSAKLQQAIQIICEEAFRCKRITDNLLSLARTSDERSSVELIALVEETVRAVEGLSRFHHRTIRIQKPAGAAIRVFANEGELRQVALNLLVNALEATDERSGVVQVELACVARLARITVLDNGVGIAPDALANLFEPFYSEKRADRPGTGLGLSIVRSIVAGHGGTIDASSEGEGKGSRFIVTLPLEESLVERD